MAEAQRWWENQSHVARFDAKVIRKGAADCWLWTAHRDKNGYGLLNINQWQHRAHRLALARALGRDLLRSEHCLHSCDTPACVNPAHLRAGSNAENRADSVAKGRNAWGERQGLSKLTEDDVHKIRRLLKQRRSQQSIADEMGVCRAAISHIKVGRTWSRLVTEGL